MRITGQNQNGQTVTWRGGYAYTFPPNSYIPNWWWRGVVKVTWRKAGTNTYYQTTAFVPQWDDQTFEMWPNIVTIDCHGSLRKTYAHATVSGTPGTIWACGGWRNGAGLTDTIYYAGYDEYQTQYRTTYALGPGGVAIPAIVTSWLRVPNC